MFLKKKFFYFAYGKFGSHGLFAIYWISLNNGPRCIGATLYYWMATDKLIYLAAATEQRSRSHT